MHSLVNSCCTHSLTHSLSHALVHSLNHAFTHSLRSILFETVSHGTIQDCHLALTYDVQLQNPAYCRALQNIALKRPLVSCSAPCEHHTDKDVYNVVVSLSLVDENELVAVLRPGHALTAGDMSHLQEGKWLHDSIINTYLALLQVGSYAAHGSCCLYLQCNGFLQDILLFLCSYLYSDIVAYGLREVICWYRPTLFVTFGFGFRYLSLCAARRTQDALRRSVVADSSLFRCVRSKVGFFQSKIKLCQVPEGGIEHSWTSVL